MLSQPELLRQKLIANGYDGLFELLSGVVGLCLGEQYILTKLFNIGGQSLLWLVTDIQNPEQSALARMALLPFHRPAYIKEADILQSRQRIEFEAQILQVFSQTPLPAFLGLYHAHNPLQAPERGPDTTETEPYLVIELIHGITLDQWARLLHSAADVTREPGLASLVFNIAYCMILLNQNLLAKGYLYADLSPRNMLLPSTKTAWPLRVVDAGSIVPVVEQIGIPVPFTWDYLLPEYYTAYMCGQNRWPTEASVLYALGKVLWQMLTARQPTPGAHPDLEAPIFRSNPSSLTHFVTQLIQGEVQRFADAAILLPGLENDLKPYIQIRA